jgi:hypothetical protein
MNEWASSADEPIGGMPKRSWHDLKCLEAYFGLGRFQDAD